MKTKDHETQECRIIDLETVILDMLAKERVKDAKKKMQDDTVERQARRIEELEAGISDCMIDLAGLIAEGK